MAFSGVEDVLAVANEPKLELDACSCPKAPNPADGLVAGVVL